MNRKNLTWLILVVIVLFLPLSVFAQGELVILHTNDLHGQSLARLATIVEEQRALHPHALLVDAGDLFSGTAVSSIFQGQAEQEAVLAMGYDALAIGNHDFDFGKAVVQKSLDRGLPWLSANIWQGEQTFAPPFAIMSLNEARVLLVGLTSVATPKMAFASNIAGLHFADPVTTLRNILQEQEGNYDLCVVLSHLGYGEDLLLAQKVPGIKAIIGGHSHTVLASPVRIRDTIIVQTGSSAQYLGKVIIGMEEGYPATAELLRIEQDTPPHPSIAQIDQHYAALMANEMGQVLGYASRDYVKRGMGHFMVEALLSYSDADAALYNGGGVRAGLQAGPITREDIFAVEPFDNQAVLVTLSGPDLAELKKIASSRSGDFFTGPRIIDLDRTYTVATSDFLANETASYSILTRGEITYLGQPVRQILEIYLQERVLDVQPKASSF